MAAKPSKTATTKAGSTKNSKTAPKAAPKKAAAPAKAAKAPKPSKAQKQAAMRAKVEQAPIPVDAENPALPLEAAQTEQPAGDETVMQDEHQEAADAAAEEHLEAGADEGQDEAGDETFSEDQGGTVKVGPDADTQVPVKVGATLVFLGYGEGVENPILQAGEKVTLVGFDKVPDDNGGAAFVCKIENAKGERDNVWAEEVQFSEEVAAEAQREQAAATAGKGKGKGMQAKKQAQMRASLAASKVQRTQDFVEGAAEGDEETVGQTRSLALVEATGETASLSEMIHNVQHTAAVQRAMQENNDALTAAKALVDQREQTYFTLGGVLAYIYANDSFKALGYDGKRGFTTYVEKELGMGYRKAMYLMETYVTFAQIGVDETVLAKIGWSKAKELARIGKKSLETLKTDLPALIEYAKDHNRDELQDHVTKTYIKTSEGSGSGSGSGEGGEETPRLEKVRLSVALVGESGNVVLNAIAAAQRIVAGGKNVPADEVGKGEALEHICGEWSLTQDGVNMPLADAIALLERRYGVSLKVEGEAPTTGQEGEEETERAAA